MTENEKKVRQIANRIKKYMKELGTYKPQYDTTIAALSEIEFDIMEAKQKYEENGSLLLVEKKSDRGAVNYAINPLKVYIDKRQNTALSFYKELGFTAQSFKKLSGDIAQVTPQKTGLEAFLENLENELDREEQLYKLEEENKKLKKEIEKKKV